MSQANNKGSSLQRVLTFSDVFSYGLLYFVPMAPIAVFGLIYNTSGGMVALTYLLAALAMVFSAISYSEMAKQIPLAGSVYSYVNEGIGPFFGFLSGWAILMDYLLLPALLAILGAIALNALFPDVPKIIWLTLFVAGPMIVNLFGIQMNTRLGKILLTIQLIVLFVFFVFAIYAAFKQGITIEDLLAPIYNHQRFSISVAFAAVPIAALSFIGFDAVSTLNEEAKGGGETVSKVTLLLLITVTILFVAQVYLAAIFVPFGTIFSSEEAETAFYTISSNIVGAWFLPIITLTSAIIAILANALVSQATSSKVIYTMARDGRLPAILNKLNKNGAPQNSIIAVGILSFIVSTIAMNKAELMVTMVTFGALTAYIMLNLSVILFFAKNKNSHILQHIISPIFGVIILAYALVNADGHAKILGTTWLIIGLMIAFILKSQNRLNVNSFDKL